MIDGVKIKQLKIIKDQRGWLMEIMRCDEPQFDKFGQVYVTTAYPGVVKAWHLHRKQTDNFTCIHGTMRIVLYDARKDSSTKEEVMELLSDENNRMLVSVPPGVYHGFKAEGDETAYFLSVPNLPYNREQPDEYRLPPDTKDIPYKWVLTPGKIHG